jgi:hypothetical protein
MGLWHAGGWALPSTTLSFASATVLVFVTAYLLRNPEMRALFLLPSPWGPVTALAAAVLAGGVAWQGRVRPGPFLPRLWALSLAVLGVALAVAIPVATGDPRAPALHAAAVGAFGAALTLLPRLGRLRPTSPWLLRLAPVSLGITLLLVLPAASAVGSRVLGAQQDRVAAQIAALHRSAGLVRSVAGEDWQHLSEHATASAQEVERLKALHPGEVARDRDLWRVAAVLDREGQLAEGVVDLQSALVYALDPARTPKVSSLRAPSLYWAHPPGETGAWRESGSFLGLSAIVGSYHHEIGRLLLEVTVPGPAERPTLAGASARLAAGRAAAEAHLRAAFASWSDRWVVFEVPGHETLVAGDRLPLVDVLRSPLAVDGADSPSAGELYRLSRLPLAAAADLAKRSPACHQHTYSEGEHQLFRVDCYSYAPRAADAGAELAVELRLVYQAVFPATLANVDFPAEVFYLFFLPPAAGGQAFRQEVMTALAQEATRRADVSLADQSRSATTATGFRLLAEGDDGRTVVLRPQLKRIVSGKDAVEVRILWEPPPPPVIQPPPSRRRALVLRGRR